MGPRLIISTLKAYQRVRGLSRAVVEEIVRRVNRELKGVGRRKKIGLR